MLTGRVSEAGLSLAACDCTGGEQWEPLPALVKTQIEDNFCALSSLAGKTACLFLPHVNPSGTEEGGTPLA